jgi:NAD(P)-dependent dehydrogenase (short-subunit alcohol dehydrogenase family)
MESKIKPSKRIVRSGATGVGQIPKDKSNIEFCSLDVLDEGSIKKKIEKIDYINVLINAAGTIARHKELQPRVFSQVVDVNLNGTMRVCSEARGLLSKSKGSIINIASMLSYFGGGVVPGYSASKGGIVQLTKSLSIAYSQDQIRVNAIAPGWISTPMTEELKLDAKRNENIINRTPMGRWGEPKELVGPALFLSSKAASFITGTVLNVDGGYACM